MTTPEGEAAEARSPWFNMTAFCAIGRLRVVDPRIAALKRDEFLVLLWAASFAALNDTDPKLFTTAAKLAERAGIGQRTVEKILPRLCGLGLLEHTRRRVTGRDGRAGPVIYRQLALGEALRRPAPRADQKQSRPAPQADQQETRPAPQADEGTAPQADEGTAPRAGHKSSHPSDPKGAEDDDADADASAPDVGSAATSASAASARASAETIAEIAELDGCTIERTEQWAEYIQSRAKIRRNPDRYLFTCQENGNGPASWSPPGPSAGQRSTTGKGSAESAKDTTPPMRTFSMRPPAGASRPPKITVRPNS